MDEIFTIGHSNHAPDAFLDLLSAHRVSAIADVRSNPVSQFAPHFSKDAFETLLRDADVEYQFLGRELGARRSEESCYVGGQAKYSLVARLPIFQSGLQRVLAGAEQYQVALLCAEADPLACHRTILVCRELGKLRPGLRITHILPDGNAESHEEAGQRLVQLHGLAHELFGNLATENGLLEEAYNRQAEKIAYRRPLEES